MALSFHGTSSPDIRSLRSLIAMGHGATNGNTAARGLLYPTMGSGRTGLFFCDGQSNSGGSATDGLFTLANPSKIKNLYIDDGGVYPAVEPLLGHGGPGSSFPIRIIDGLITAGKLDNAMIVPFGVGATIASEHAPGGQLHHRIIAAAECVRALGLTPTYTFFLWHQGESDCLAGTSQASMSSSLNGIFGAVKALIPGVYIFVAKASYIFGNVSPGIIAAQNAQIDNNNRIYDFGDYDGIVSGHRLSNVDYAIAGMADATLIGYPKIAAFLDAH